jgi:ribokinase
MSERPKIVVVGSLNVDHTLRVPRLPAPGETLRAKGAHTCFGGKGANQALAAARAGGEVALIGCVGGDGFGDRYLQYLRDEGIRTDGITKVAAPTGSAFIAVDDSGENTILFNPGANDALEPQHLDTHASLIRSAAVLLFQLECPLPTILHAARIAAASGVPLILNASPLSPEFIEARMLCDTLIVNGHEAAMLSAMTLDALEAEARRALEMTHCQQLIVTRGGNPTLAITAGETLRIAPPKVTPVDTVGAGDAFAGAFAVAVASGVDLTEAVRFANAAGALAAQMVGAQSSIPNRDAIVRLAAAYKA